MMNKRSFLKGGAAALATSTAAAATLAAVPPTLGALSGARNWQAHVGQTFEIDGHAVALQAVAVWPSRQLVEQFSLRFSGNLPAHLGEGIHALTHQGGASLALYVVPTPQGLRADFCRLQG